MIGRAMDLLPSAWSDGAKMAALIGLLVLCFAVPVLMMVLAFGKRRPPAAAAAALANPPGLLAGPDLNPDEWVSGDVIHYDRQKAFGYIRCERVKGHVRFQATAFKRAPRIGEKVRFKGRYGGRRKPVAVVVEPLAKVSRAS